MSQLLIAVVNYKWLAGLCSKRPFRWLQDMYQASFERVQRAMPADLFWLWTQEIWNARSSTDPHVGGINSSAVSSVVEDFLAADAAAKAMNASSFGLGTSGAFPPVSVSVSVCVCVRVCMCVCVCVFIYVCTSN